MGFSPGYPTVTIQAFDPPADKYPITLTVSATNSCGTASASKTIYMDCSGGGIVNPLSGKTYRAFTL